MVLGSRFIADAAPASVPRCRRLLLRIATLFTRITTGLAVTDTHNGLRAFKAAAAPHLEITLNGMAHASQFLERIARAGLRWREVPVVIRYTPYSVATGQRMSNLFNILWDLVVRR